MPSPRPLSVVVPVRNGTATLAQNLSAILATDLPRDDYELIVVDDSSTDGSSELAARFADTVVRLTGRTSGPAYARNRGAELAQGDILAFVDADVMVRSDTLSRMVRMLGGRPELTAVSASHDQTSAAGNLVSQYCSLLLHFGDQREGGSSGNVASPCAAIRRDAFLSAGMYDEWRFETAPVEGIEFGKRLEDSGMDVLSCRDIQITALRKWSLRSLCREVWSRSAVVARSLGYQRTRRAVPGDMVFTLSRSVVAAFAVLCVLAFSAAFLPHPNTSSKVGIVLLGAIALNLTDYLYFAKARGIHFALAVAPLHFLMKATSGLGLCVGWVLRDAFGDGAPDAATQAYAEVGLETWPPVRRSAGD